MSALAISILVFLVLLVLFSSRKWALLAMMAGVLYLTQRAGVELLGVNFHAMRFLAVAGFVRVVMRKELPSHGLNGIDKAFILVYVYATVVFLLRSSMGYGTSADVVQVGTMDRIGLLVDSGLGYVVFRALIGSMDDLVSFLKDFILLLMPFVALLLVERTTGQNPFVIVGGLTQFYDPIRVRCLGSFSHPSLLGTFGASFLPLYIGLALAPHYRIAAFTGIVLCATVVVLSNSGGPASFAGVTVIAWLLWMARQKLRFVRWAFIFSLGLIGLFMKAPLWYLPAKASLILGGDGWHRSRFMEVAFGDISKWWLAGMPLDLTRDWFPHLVGGAADIANQYLKFGLDAGLLAIFLFTLLLVRAFRMLGQAMSKVRLTSEGSSDDEFILWGLGAMLLGHVFNWLAITYFDQTQIVWIMQIAAIASVTQIYTSSKSVRLESPLRQRRAPLTGLRAKVVQADE